MTLKKLLVLDVNGLLIDTYYYKKQLPQEAPDARVGNFYVYKRPFCNEFLQFCLENFIVGIWSSAREYNVNNLVEYVFGEAKDRLAFAWHQSYCTDVGLKSPDNESKPLFMKELSKLWRRGKVDLPWNEGDYGPSNTLLVDDTPYKAVLNPPNTAIFPRPYSVQDRGDDFLGGALRSYLEGIRDAAHVQTYVENNSFGEPSITPENPLWSHVSEILLRVQNVSNTVGDKVAELVPIESVCDDGYPTCRHTTSRQKKRDDYGDTLQQTRDGIKLCDEFSSEAKEPQSSKHVGPSLETMGQHDVLDDSHMEQGNTICQREKEMNSFSRFHKGDEEQHKNDQLSLEITHVDSCTNHGNRRKKAQTRPSVQLEDQQVFEGTKEGSTEKGQPGQFEEKEKDLTADEETHCEHHESSEEKGNMIYHHEEKFDGNSQLSSSKSEFMEAEDIQEQSHRKQSHEQRQWITQRTDGPQCTSNDFKGAHYQLHHSGYSGQKHNMFQGEPAAGQNKRSYYGIDNIDHSRHWKRQKGCYQRDNSCGQYRSMKCWSYQDNRTDSLCYDHSSKRERARYPGFIMPPFNGLRQKEDYKDRGHLINDTGKGYRNRDTPLNLNANYSWQSHGNRRIDNPAEYLCGSNRASPNRMTHINYIGQSCRNEGDVGIMPPNMNMFDQDRYAPSYQQHKGFDARTPKGSSPHPKTTEDWSVRGWHPYLGKRDGGGPRGPHRDQGAFSHSYTRDGGAPRPSYQSNGASKQWHHFNSNEREKGGAPWGYSGSRQH